MSGIDYIETDAYAGEKNWEAAESAMQTKALQFAMDKAGYHPEDIDVMLEQKKPMSKLLEGLTIYPQELENVRVKDKKAAREDRDVQAAVEAVAARHGQSDPARLHNLARLAGGDYLTLQRLLAGEDDELTRDC